MNLELRSFSYLVCVPDQMCLPWRIAVPGTTFWKLLKKLWWNVDDNLMPKLGSIPAILAQLYHNKKFRTKLYILCTLDLIFQSQVIIAVSFQVRNLAVTVDLRYDISVDQSWYPSSKPIWHLSILYFLCDWFMLWYS